MGIMLVIVGIVLIVTGAQDTYASLGAQLQKDFTGPKNFTYWFAAIVMVGALGAIPQLHTFSRAFMALILLALLLSNKGAFANLSAALKSGPVAPKVSGTGTGAAGTTPGTNVPTPVGGEKTGTGINLGPTLGNLDLKTPWGNLSTLFGGSK